MGALSHGRIEVMVLPVSDVDRAKAFYVDRAGFGLDVDYEASADFRVVQITPPGSAYSIQLIQAAGPIEPRETDRTPYASFADFTDPDRHRWVMQDVAAPR